MPWRWENAFPKSHLADQPRHTRFERSSCVPSFHSDNVITSLRPEGMPWRWENALPKSHLADPPTHTRFERSSCVPSFHSDSVIASLRPEVTPWRWRNAFLKSYLLDSPIHTSFERSSAALGQVDSSLAHCSKRRSGRSMPPRSHGNGRLLHGATGWTHRGRKTGPGGRRTGAERPPAQSTGHPAEAGSGYYSSSTSPIL